MKSKLIITIILASLSSTVLAQSYIKSRLKEGFFPGTHNGQSCQVNIKYTQHPLYHFQLGITSAQRQTEHFYRLYEGPLIGGRGDCPRFYVDNSQEIFVMNEGTKFPCSSSPDRVNHGGLRVTFGEEKSLVRVYNEKREILSQCTVNFN